MEPDNSSTAENIIERIKQEKRQELRDRSLSHGSVSHLKIIDSYSAVVWHPDVNDIWAI